MLLDDWDCSYRGSIQSPPYWSTSTRTPSHCFIGDSHTSFWFPDVVIANGFTTLWALQIICTIHLNKVMPLCPGQAREDVISQTGANNIYTRAKWICMSMEFLIQDEGKLHSQATTLFPLRMVYSVFTSELPRRSEEANWCEGIVAQLAFKGVNLSSLL